MKIWFDRSVAWHARHPALPILYWILFYNFEKFAFGPYSYVEMGDEADSRLAFMVAWWHWFFEPFRHYWTNDALGGFDTLSAAVDPGLEALFFASMPGWLAYATHRLACIFLQSYFTFRLLRDGLSVSLSIALGCAFLYPTIIHHYYPDEQMFAALPMILWALHRPWGGSARTVFVFAALAFFYSYFSAYAFTLFTIPVIWAWSCAFFPRDRTRWLGLTVFTVVYAALNAARIYGGVLFGSESARSYNNQWYTPIYNGLMMANGYWGAALVFAALIACIVWRDARLIRVTAVELFVLLIGPAVGGVMLALAQVFEVRAFTQVTVRTFNTAPFLIVVILGVLSNRIVLELAGRRTARSMVAHLPALTGAAISLFALANAIGIKQRTIWDQLHSSVYAFAFENPILKAFSAAALPSQEPFRVTTFSAFRTNYRLEEAFLWTYGFETAGGYVNLWPNRYRDYWRRLLAKSIEKDPLIEIKMNNRAHLYMNESGFIWEMCRPQPVRACVLRPADFYNLNLLAYLNVRYIVTPIPFDDPALELLPSDIRDALLRWETEKVSARWKAALKGAPSLHMPLYIYRFRDEFPRFFVARNIATFETSIEALDSMAGADLKTLRSTAFLDRNTARILGDSAGWQGGEVRLIARASDELTLGVAIRKGGVLMTSMSYNRFWRACVNGNPATPVRVNHAFLGIGLPAGAYEVRLSYDPPWRPGGAPCR